MLSSNLCSCGMVMLAKEGDGNVRPCPRCGCLLPGQADPAAAAGPAPDTLETTVALKPFYALEAPVEASAISYRAVELPDPAGEGSQSTLVFQSEPRPYARNDIDDREVRRILLKASRELRVHAWLRPLPWKLERNGWECLVYPLRFCGALLTLGFSWTIVSPLVVLALPTPDTDGVDAWLPRIPFLVCPLTLLGMTWSFLRQVLRLGVMGDNETAPKLFEGVYTVATSGLMVIASFLAGPIVLLAAAVWFWIHAGPLEWLDRVLLWQLWLCTGIGWMYLLLAAEGRRGWRDAQAKAVATLIRRQGRAGVLFPVLGGVSLTIFAYLSISIWVVLTDAGMSAFVLQFPLWCAALFLWTFLLRWYGVTRYWSRQARLDP